MCGINQQSIFFFTVSINMEVKHFELLFFLNFIYFSATFVVQCVRNWLALAHRMEKDQKAFTLFEFLNAFNEKGISKIKSSVQGDVVN